MVVRRVLAVLLISALTALSGAGSRLHTHAYTDHDHPEHHHGLAAHGHHAVPVHPADGAVHLDGCDPGNHTISFPSLCAAVPHVDAAIAEFCVAALPAPDFQRWRILGYEDLRTHAPPIHRQDSPRAPPVIVHA